MSATASFVTPWTCAAVAARFSKVAFSIGLNAPKYVDHRETARAMAAVKFNKPLAAVTRREAAAALADYVTPGDADLTGRTLRAGVRTAHLKREPLPESLVGELVGGLNRLDAGETKRLGMLTPAKTKRRKSPGGDAEDALILAVEVAYQTAKHHIPRDEAIEIVTGIPRGAKRPTAVAGLPPILPVGAMMTIQTIRRLVDRGRQDNPDPVAAAHGEGEAERRGEPLAPDFQAFRQAYMALWAARLTAGRVPGKKETLPTRG
jgi:hypothetical protein